MIQEGKAYVDSQTPEEVQGNRGGGADNMPGIDSPFRNRTPEENMQLFKEMAEVFIRFLTFWKFYFVINVIFIFIVELCYLYLTKYYELKIVYIFFR